MAEHTTVITCLLVYDSRDAVHTSGQRTRSCRQQTTNVGFTPLSTAHIDSTVLYHINHDTANLYKHEAYLSIKTLLVITQNKVLLCSF